MPLSAQQNQLLARIREMLDRTDTIVFVGSGISRWSGLPSWGGLIEELANYIETQGQSAEIVRKELKAKDLLQAASYGVDLLTKPQFAEFMRLACRVDTSMPHEIHKEIISLGSSCFITTNYDQLLEQSFSRWQPEKRLRIVSNNQLIETANIIQAKSSQFIFKPHGDINDSESLILSREHYRKLTGEKFHVLKALETLLASRPVIFLGFGLRDLDFLYIKDLLANIYKGGTMDHYAIMADISEQEITYWRKNFGIHILSYSTSENESGHQPLLDILQELNNVARKNIAVSDSNNEAIVGFTPDKILAIARYSANIVHSTAIQNESHIPLRVSPKKKDEHENITSHRNTFDYSEAEHFLETYPQNAILIGNPGSGKSYSLRRVLYKLAQNLQSSCLQNEFETEALVFPIYLDLKLYDGDIFEMINQILPPDFSLEHLSGFKKIRFYLDSYNELPNIYIDNGKFREDLGKLLTDFDSSTMIIASRFAEGLINLDYPAYQIEDIDYKFVEKQLGQLDFQLPERFQREIISLLQKPLFYRLYKEKKIALTQSMTPVDVYKSFTERMSSELSSILKTSIPIDDLFNPLAYEMLSNGVETFAVDNLQLIVAEYLQKINSIDIKPIDVINWLISQNFIIPASNLRLSFFHQSITEYFAALMLSRKYKETPTVLDEILKFTRWDQCLYLTTNFLDDKSSTKFIQHIMTADLLVAIQAAKYLEHNSDEIIFQILSTINDNKESSVDRLSFSLTELPVTKFHEEILYKLLETKNIVGGNAAKLLVDILGKDVKNTLIEELFSYPNNFNHCMHIGRSLNKTIELSDFQDLFNRFSAFTMDTPSDDSILGLIHGLAEASSNLQSAELIDFFQDWKNYTSTQVSLACDILAEVNNDNQSLSLLVEMATSGVKDAIVPLYFNIAHRNQDEDEIDWSILSIELVEALIANLDDDEGDWAVSCIRSICKGRRDIQEYIEKRTSDLTGVKKIALLSCLSEIKNEFWEELNLLAKFTPAEIESEPIFLLEQLDVDWNGKEHILINLLKTNNHDLLTHLLNTNFWDTKAKNYSLNLGVESVAWWLDWMNNLTSISEDKDDKWFIKYRIGEMLPKYIDKEALQLILDDFNDSVSKHRSLIKNYLLRNIPNLSLESFTEESISYLIQDLNNSQIHEAFSIGQVATELFVEEKLIPLIGKKSEPFNENLLKAIEIAGETNNHRFLI